MSEICKNGTKAYVSKLEAATDAVIAVKSKICAECRNIPSAYCGGYCSITRAIDALAAARDEKA